MAERRFEPVSEDAAGNLLKPGEYGFTVLWAEESERAATGALMFKLKLDVFDGKGKSYHVYDYLGTDFMQHKLRHFCYAVGLGAEYEDGVVYASDMSERSGRVKVKIEKSDGYDDKNAVIDYVVPPAKPSAEQRSQELIGVPAAQTRRAKPIESDDDIPF